MGVKVTFDKNAVKMRLHKAKSKALYVTSEQALKDCNYYCKQDQSGLIDSSLTASEPEKGLLRWKTPYARKQYYLKETNKDINSHAEWMWAHKAKSVKGKQWRKIFQQAFSKGAKL